MLDLLRQPHYVFTGPVDRLYPDRLANLEALVPGALAYGYQRGSRKRLRLTKLAELKVSSSTIFSFEIIVVIHGGFLVEGYLDGMGATFDVKAGGGADYVTPINPAFEPTYSQHGSAAIKRLVEKGVLKGNLVDKPYPWQPIGTGIALTRPWAWKIWPTGTGKTAGAIADLAAVVTEKHPGDIIIACPGGARPVWLIQLPEYCGWRPYVLQPDSKVRKKDESLDDYLDFCRLSGQPAVVVVGFENALDHLETLSTKIRPTAICFDEIHKLGSHARWTPIYNPDGTVSYKPKTTTSGQENQAVAVMRLSEIPSIRFRLGLSATPLGEGRPRRLWSQTDLLGRGSFAYSYWTFVKRYCGGGPADFGSGIDDSGQTNSEELQQRLSFLCHQVPHSVTRASMQPFNVQIVRLPKELQVEPEKFDDNQTFNQAIKEAAKEELVNNLVRGRTVEYRLMEAASRKRRWVIDQAVEGLRGGGKVVVFTGRRKEVEVWQERIVKAASQGDNKVGTIKSFGYHGGCTDKQRVEIIEAFKFGKGPLLLVATGQSMGTSIDGLQAADLAILAMLPWTADEFIQQRGRFDRGGDFAVPTTLLVPVALGTYDERVVSILTEKFGNIEELFMAEEIEGLSRKMTGTDNQQASLADMLAWLTETT